MSSWKIFTQPEELEGSELKAAMVHGRKNQQAMVDEGRLHTDMPTVMEMLADSTAVGVSTINDATECPQTELHVPTAMTSTMTLNPSQHPKSDNLIHIPNDCFNINRQDTTRLNLAVVSHRSWMKKKVKDPVFNPSLSPPHQARTLRAVVIDLDIRSLSASTALSPVPTNERIINSIKETIKLATRTKHAFGRPSDDKRSLVQSIVLTSLPPPTSNRSAKPAKNAMASALGLSLHTCKRHVKVATPKDLHWKIWKTTLPFACKF